MTVPILYCLTLNIEDREHNSGYNQSEVNTMDGRFRRKERIEERREERREQRIIRNLNAAIEELREAKRFVMRDRFEAAEEEIEDALRFICRALRDIRCEEII